MGAWRRPSRSEAEGSMGGSGNCGNPLGCRYGRCSSNTVAGMGGVAESAETPYGDSPAVPHCDAVASLRRRITGHGTVQQSVLAFL
jgi:hypothetical protein